MAVAKLRDEWTRFARMYVLIHNVNCKQRIREDDVNPYREMHRMSDKEIGDKRKAIFEKMRSGSR